MATKVTFSKYTLEAGDEVTFELKSGVIAVLVFEHPYSGSKGMYTIIGGYASNGATEIKADSRITITKPTSTSCKVKSTSSTFLRVLFM